MKENNKLYCIYCGQDEDKGHYDNCPIIKGTPYMVLGVKQRENDKEFNLNLGRMAQLFSLGEQIGTGNEKRNQRLAYEFVAFKIRRIMPALNEVQTKSKNKILGMFARKKLKELNRQIDEIYELAKSYNISKKEVDEIWEQKILLMSTKEMIPAYREIKTKKLIYLPLQ
ncbi:MAG: hypothetical protein PHF86_11055 [Candidatus Nanoarchaeia archaeon]|nr:hypothetical protein [Candidatus Nanoarchaeia archaeon]